MGKILAAGVCLTGFAVIFALASLSWYQTGVPEWLGRDVHLAALLGAVAAFFGGWRWWYAEAELAAWVTEDDTVDRVLKVTQQLVDIVCNEVDQENQIEDLETRMYVLENRFRPAVSAVSVLSPATPVLSSSDLKSALDAVDLGADPKPDLHDAPTGELPPPRAKGLGPNLR